MRKDGVQGILPSEKTVLNELGLEHLVLQEIKSPFRRTHYRAILNWITRYRNAANSSNLDRVRGLLEAFSHFCKLEEWKSAALTMSLPLNSSVKAELQEHLGIWGYYNEQIELYKQLMGKLTPAVDSVCLNGLGNAYHSLGRYQQSIDYHQQDLELAQRRQDRTAVGNALGGLGNAYNALGNYPQATDYYHQWLSTAQAVEDRSGEAKALGSLGNVSESLGCYDQAIGYYQQCLAIAVDRDDSFTESLAYGGLANVYSSQNQYTEAINCYQRWFKSAQENGDRGGESKALRGLGHIYHRSNCHGNPDQAISILKDSLEISRAINDPQGESVALIELGNVYHSLNNSTMTKN